MMSIAKQILCVGILALALAGCGPEKASVGVIGGTDSAGAVAVDVADASVGTAAGAGAATASGTAAGAAQGAVVAPPVILGDGASAAQCETDSGLACPLAKPVQDMTKSYVRTPEQIAQMEAFDALTLEEKFYALQSGEVVCKEFVHDYAWEHVIDQKLIQDVGQEGYEKWLTLDDGCQSIYSFIVAFDWSKEEFIGKVEAYQLQDVYFLDKMKF